MCFFLFTGRGGTRAGELCKITKNPNRTLNKKWIGGWGTGFYEVFLLSIQILKKKTFFFFFFFWGGGGGGGIRVSDFFFYKESKSKIKTRGPLK